MSALTYRVFSSALATSVMTLFGYVYSFISARNLKEPELLGKLIKRAFSKINMTNSLIVGWCLHYSVGLLFTEMYRKFWNQAPPEDRLKSGFEFGAVCGLAAILIWRITFHSHPQSPSVDFIRFSINLLIGHILFGVVSALTIGYYDGKLLNNVRALRS